MLYKGKQMELKEYFNTRIKEINTVDNEAMFSIIADYISSCDINFRSEVEFIENLGFTVEDFFGEMEYEVTIESSCTKKVLYEGTDFKKALETYDCYNNGNGCYYDGNNFCWELYFDSYEMR